MNKEKTVSEWIDYYKSQKDYMEGWYDWFCMDKSLKAKTENFSKILERLVNAQPKIGSAYRVWFKNNCPMNGSLYDDLRFEYNKDGKELDGEERMKYYFVISIDSPTAAEGAGGVIRILMRERSVGEELTLGGTLDVERY